MNRPWNVSKKPNEWLQVRICVAVVGVHMCTGFCSIVSESRVQKLSFLIFRLQFLHALFCSTWPVLMDKNYSKYLIHGQRAMKNHTRCKRNGTCEVFHEPFWVLRANVAVPPPRVHPFAIFMFDTRHDSSWQRRLFSLLITQIHCPGPEPIYVTQCTWW